MPLITSLIMCITTFWLVVLGWYDYYENKLPNVLTLGGLVVFFAIRVWMGGKVGLMDALCGGTIGFLFLLIPFILRGAGAGDVKMLTAVGVLVGFPLILHVLTLCSILGILMGGYVFITKRIGVARLCHWARCCFCFRYDSEEGRKALPPPDKKPLEVRFGLAIALGTWFSIVFNLLRYAPQS